jgi:hypothetical protein
MMRLRFLVLTLLFPLSGARFAPSPPARSAVLTSLRGTVEVKRNGRDVFLATRSTTLLSPGDMVRTGREGSAVLIYPDARTAALGAQQTVAAEAGSARPVPAFTVLRKQLESVLSREGDPLAMRGYVLRGYALRDGEEASRPVLALVPRQSLVLEGRPVFRWRADRGTSNLTLTLYDRDEKVAWSAALDPASSSREYPDDARPLAPGEYIWEITGKINGRPELSSARFTIPAPRTAAAVKATLKSLSEAGPDSSLLLIAAQLEYRLYPQAEASLVAARERTPGDRTLALLLAKVYSETRRSVPTELLAGE